MAFDFGAALSSIGQIAPAMTEGAEIRRQRLNDQARAQQEAQAAQDTHAQREAQTARERQLTTNEANRVTVISDKPFRGNDGQYYILGLDAQNKLQRFPVGEGYDPLAEKKALAAAVGAPEGSDLYTAIVSGIKPTAPQFTTETDAQGNHYFVQKPGTGGLPSSANPNDLTASTVSDQGAKPANAPSKGVNVIPTGIRGRVPSDTTTTATHVYHWVDNQGQVHETPYTTMTTRKANTGTPSTAPPPRSASTGQPRPASPPRSGLIGGDKIIGTGKLPAAAEKVVITTQPVIDQTNRLIQDIDKLGLANNNTRGYLAMDYANYRLGKAAPAGTLANDIAGLSLGSVVDAASALQGSSRSLMALKQAMIHTPNPIIDSPQLLREKLVTINARLKDMVENARSAGQGAQAPSQSPAAWEKILVNPTTKQRIGLRAGKYYDLQTGKEVQ